MHWPEDSKLPVDCLVDILTQRRTDYRLFIHSLLVKVDHRIFFILFLVLIALILLLLLV